MVWHDRPDLTGAPNDEVYAERKFTTGEFFGPEIRAKDRERCRRPRRANPCAACRAPPSQLDLLDKEFDVRLSNALRPVPRAARVIVTVVDRPNPLRVVIR